MGRRIGHTLGDMQFETLAIHAGQEPDPTTGAVVPPIYQVSTYKQDGVGGLRGGYEYSRSANPTRTALEECLAAIEGGRRGLAFASGLAAEDTLLRTVCKPGDHVVVPNDAYGGTYRLFAKVLDRWGLEYTTVGRPRGRRGPGGDPARDDEGDLGRDADQPAARHRRHRGARRARARRRARCSMVDNTFATPYLQQPLALGADVVVHSTTKYMGGHSDVVGGALVSPATSSARSWPTTRTRWAPSPGRSTRGWSCAASRRSACGWTGTAPTPSASSRCSTSHPKVTEVLYPGLPGAPRPRGRGQADEGVRRHGVVPGRAAARTRRSRSATGPRSSPWASRSAASSR